METKKCPICGEEIPAKAKKCKYCKEWIADPAESAQPSGEAAGTPAPQPPVVVIPPQGVTPNPAQQTPPPPPPAHVNDGYDDDDDDDTAEATTSGGGLKHFFGNFIHPSRGKAFWISICSALAILIAIILLIIFGGDIKDKIEDISYEAQSSMNHRGHKSRHSREFNSSDRTSRSNASEDDEEEHVEDEGDMVAQMISEASYINQGYYVGSGSIGKYPVKVKLGITDDGSVNGKYAYESTLNKFGDVESSWIGLKGRYGENQTMELEYDQYYPDKNNDTMTFTYTPNGDTLTLDGTIYLNPPTGASKTMPMKVTLEKK